MKKLLIPISVGLLALGCQTETEVAPTHETATPKTGQPTTAEKTPAAKNDPGTPSTNDDVVLTSPVGTCRPSDQMESVVSQLIDHADANHDGKISKKEAQGLMNFVLGGFFFRADENGDGKVTPAEGRAARQEFAEQNPALAALLQEAKRIKKATGESPLVRIADMMDIDYTKPLAASDVREAAHSALDDLFGLVDANRDGTLTLAEAREASRAGAEALGHQAFAAADTNSDGSVDMNELDKAVEDNLRIAFSAADRNNDGKLTEAESAAAFGALARQLGLPTRTSNK